MQSSISNEMKVEILSPEKILFKGVSSEVSVPGKLGYMTILPGHTALIAELDVGELTLGKASEQGHQKYFVAGGFVEVKDNAVKVLVDVIEKPQDIDRDRASKAEKRASERLIGKSDSGKHADDIDYARAMAALKRAQTRLTMSVLGRSS